MINYNVPFSFPIQWIRRWRAARDGGRHWDLRRLYSWRPSMHPAFGTRFSPRIKFKEFPLLCLASIKVTIRIISRSVWKRRATSDSFRGCPRYPHSLPQGGIDRRHNIILIYIVLKYCHGNNNAGQGVIRAEATFLTPSGDNFGCVWIRVAVDH